MIEDQTSPDLLQFLRLVPDRPVSEGAKPYLLHFVTLDPGRRREMAERARRYAVAELSLETYLDRYERLFFDLMASVAE